MYVGVYAGVFVFECMCLCVSARAGCVRVCVCVCRYMCVGVFLSVCMYASSEHEKVYAYHIHRVQDEGRTDTTCK